MTPTSLLLCSAALFAPHRLVSPSVFRGRRCVPSRLVSKTKKTRTGRLHQTNHFNLRPSGAESRFLSPALLTVPAAASWEQQSGAAPATFKLLVLTSWMHNFFVSVSGGRMMMSHQPEILSLFLLTVCRVEPTLSTSTTTATGFTTIIIKFID